MSSPVEKLEKVLERPTSPNKEDSLARIANALEEHNQLTRRALDFLVPDDNFDD